MLLLLILCKKILYFVIQCLLMISHGCEDLVSGVYDGQREAIRHVMADSRRLVQIKYHSLVTRL
jgi:hypothetical protein